MKYQVPLAWFARGDGVRVVDDRGREAFRLAVESPGEAGQRVTFRDRRGDPLAYVARRQLAGDGGVAFEVYHGDDLQAVLKRDGCSPRQCRFLADGPYPDDLHAEGNLAGREYVFTREGRTVGRVGRSLAGSTDAYGVDVGRGEDEVLLLAYAIVIDLCCQPTAQTTLPDPRLAG